MQPMDDRLMKDLRSGAAPAFEGLPVLFAYLFGSHARDDARRTSDVDIAVYIAEPPSGGPELALELAARLAGTSGVGGIEVVVLNDSPVALRGRAVRERVVLYSRDEPARVEFESRTLREFFDFQLHAGPLDDRLLREIVEGRR